MTTLDEQYRDAIGRLDYPAMRYLADALDAEDEAEAQAREAALSDPKMLGRSALYYASLGVPVFPLQARGKEPVVKKGVHAASTDPEQIRHWWRQFPDANIGGACGVKFDVIDIDGPPGVASCWGETGFYPSLPPLIGHALTTRPEGGGHHLFVPPTGQGPKVNLFPGVDYRGVASYVVLAPSIAENGRRWRWIQNLKVQP